MVVWNTIQQIIKFTYVSGLPKVIMGRKLLAQSQFVLANNGVVVIAKLFTDPNKPWSNPECP